MMKLLDQVQHGDLNLSDSYCYLATPYNKYPSGTTTAWVHACQQAAILMSVGVKIFCPIAHSHGIDGALHPTQRNGEFWLPMDYPMFVPAKALIICQLPGWAESEGIRTEMGWAVQLKKPLIMMEPGIVPRELL